MDKEEDKKPKIFNSIHMNEKVKKRYFRVEKTKFNSSTLRRKESKKIFKPKKNIICLKERHFEN